MPNIVEFSSPEAERGLRPAEGGSEAFAQEGRRIGAFYHQEGQDVGSTLTEAGRQVEAHQAFQEISHASAVGAQLQTSLDDDLNKTLANADPNDPSTTSKWAQEKLEPALQSYLEAPATREGKQFALAHANSLRQFFREKAAAGQSELAGAAVVSNANTQLNNAMYGVQQDPTTGDLARGTWRATMESLISTHPNLSPQQVAAYRELSDKGLEQITLAQAHGMARANPDAAISAIEAGGPFAQYAAGREDEMLAYAKERKNAQFVDQERQREATKQATEDKSQSTANQYLSAWGSTDVTSDQFEPQWTQKVLSDPNLLPATKDSLVAMAHRLHDEATSPTPIRTDPGTLEGLLGRIGSSTPPTQPEVLGLVGRGLTREDAQFVMEHANPKTPLDEISTKALDAEMGLWKASTASPGAGMMGGKDAAGEQAYSDAVNFYLPLIKQGLAAGHSITELTAPPNQSEFSIYRVKPLEKFAPDQSPTAAVNIKHQAQSSSILDAVTSTWNKVQGMVTGAGGPPTSVRFPIDRSAAPPSTEVKPGSRVPLSAIFGAPDEDQ